MYVRSRPAQLKAYMPMKTIVRHLGCVRTVASRVRYTSIEPLRRKGRVHCIGSYTLEPVDQVVKQLYARLFKGSIIPGIRLGQVSRIHVASHFFPIL